MLRDYSYPLQRTCCRWRSICSRIEGGPFLFHLSTCDFMFLITHRQVHPVVRAVIERSSGGVVCHPLAQVYE